MVPYCVCFTVYTTVLPVTLAGVELAEFEQFARKLSRVTLKLCTPPLHGESFSWKVAMPRNWRTFLPAIVSLVSCCCSCISCILLY